MENIAVKLAPKIARRGGGFVDPQNGVAIAVGRQRRGFQIVPNTGFIQARIFAGDLLKIELPAAEPSSGDLEKSPKAVHLRFTKKYKFCSQKYGAGEEIVVSPEVAAELVAEGVAEVFQGNDEP